jgi:acyl-homoserine lactone acylase PvdQ
MKLRRYRCAGLAFLGLGVLLCRGAVAQDAARGLWSEVTIYRDEWGVPHVYADTVRALGFGFGYAQAADHIEPMLFAYRLANGRAAEIMGEAYAASDEFSLRMAHARLAARAWPGVDPVTRDVCEGFALGVNAWLLDHASEAPPWADGVQPQDILALWHAFLMSFAPFDLPGVWRRPRAFDTGNAWALAPSRTEEGRTLLVINPHQHHDGPFRWYEAHLAVADYDVSGATLFGLPVLLVGHNAALGWALTPNAPDFADVYQERVAQGAEEETSPRNFGRRAERRIEEALREHLPALLYYSQAQPYYVRTPNGLQERYTPSYVLGRGPVFEAENSLFTWRIGGYFEFGGLRQLMEMGRAATVADFEAALAAGQLPCFHVLAADRGGNLAYVYNARAGTRDLPAAYYESGEIKNEAQTTWKIPVPAHWDASAWGTLVPMDRLPRVENPATGYLQACGNPPAGATDEAVVLGGGWPAWFATDADTYRARRVRQLLRSGVRNFRDMQSLLYDTVVPAAEDMGGRLLAIAQAQPERVEQGHPDLAAALELLRGWNFTAELNVPGMTFYHVWWAMLRTRHAAEFGDDRALYATLLSENPEAQAIALEAASDAARLMRNEFDRIAVPWGEAHVIRRGSRTEGIFGAGTGEPLFVASDLNYSNRKWEASYGYGFAMVVELGASPRAVSMVPFGTSEDPSSRHFSDQLDLMLQRRFKVTRFQREEVLRHAATGQGLRVTLAPPGVDGLITVAAQAPLIASARATADPPAPLPAGLRARTLYLEVKREPGTLPVAVSLALRLPETPGGQGPQAGLSLHVHEPGLGWRRVPTLLDPAQGTVQAEYGAAGVFVVAGPAAELVVPGARDAAQPDAAAGDS